MSCWCSGTGISRTPGSKCQPALSRRVKTRKTQHCGRCREESGLTDVRVVGFLGRYLHNAAPHRDEVHDRYVYHLELTGSAEQSWLHYETNPSDGGPPIAFSFFWMSLRDPELRLDGGQGDLLPRLRRLTRKPEGLWAR